MLHTGAPEPGALEFWIYMEKISKIPFYLFWPPLGKNSSSAPDYIIHIQTDTKHFFQNIDIYFTRIKHT